MVAVEPLLQHTQQGADREQTGSRRGLVTMQQVGLPKWGRCNDGGSQERCVVHLNNGASFCTNYATDLHSEWTRVTEHRSV